MTKKRIFIFLVVVVLVGAGVAFATTRSQASTSTTQTETRPGHTGHALVGSGVIGQRHPEIEDHAGVRNFGSSHQGERAGGRSGQEGRCAG